MVHSTTNISWSNVVFALTRFEISLLQISSSSDVQNLWVCVKNCFLSLIIDFCLSLINQYPFIYRLLQYNIIQKVWRMIANKYRRALHLKVGEVVTLGCFQELDRSAGANSSSRKSKKLESDWMRLMAMYSVHLVSTLQ